MSLRKKTRGRSPPPSTHRSDCSGTTSRRPRARINSAARRLDIARLVRRSAHDESSHGRSSSHMCEKRECALDVRRRVERRGLPRLAASVLTSTRVILPRPLHASPRHRPPARRSSVSGYAGDGDDRLRVHLEAELSCRAVGERVGVLRRFPARHPWLGAELEAAKPFHVGVALPAGQQQAHRESLLGPQRLAVLRPDDERVVHALSRSECCARSRHASPPSARNHFASRFAHRLRRAASRSGTPVHSELLVMPATCCGVSPGFGLPNMPPRQASRRCPRTR